MAGISSALLADDGNADLGWKPQYQFPTPATSVQNSFTLNPQRFNGWRNFSQPTNNFFPKTSTPTQATQPQMVDKPFGSEWKPTWG